MPVSGVNQFHPPGPLHLFLHDCIASGLVYVVSSIYWPDPEPTHSIKCSQIYFKQLCRNLIHSILTGMKIVGMPWPQIYKSKPNFFFYMSVIVASDCFDVSNPDPARMTWIRNLLSRTIIYLMIVTISNDLELECVEDRFDQSRYGVRRMVSIEDILPLNKGWNQRIYRTDTRTAPPPVVINWNVSPRHLWRQLYRQTGSAVNCRQSKERRLNLRRRGGGVLSVL